MSVANFAEELIDDLNKQYSKTYVGTPIVDARQVVRTKLMKWSDNDVKRSVMQEARAIAICVFIGAVLGSSLILMITEGLI